MADQRSTPPEENRLLRHTGDSRAWHIMPKNLWSKCPWLILLLLGHAAPAAGAQASEPGYLPVQSGRAMHDPMTSEAMRSDAGLWDVCFVDVDRGWAVGDRGTIWHTRDGGRNWHLQRSGVACPIQSVFFVDRQTGWAVGGSIHPYTHTSSGVVLRTRDGGQNWSHDPHLLLPSLKQVRFLDKSRGWAVGCSSEMFPSGLFVTEDGGRSWSPLPGSKAGGWSAADFLAPHLGALAGRDGSAAVMRPGGQGIELCRTPRFGLRRLGSLKLVAPVYGWLVGDGGLVMMTRDLGTNWETTPGELPEGIRQQFDFRALAVRGPKAWIAGNPGTRILHSPDAGRSWQVLPTGQNLPVSALAFADDEHGWAVGQLGIILATADGGKSWHQQRAGGSRAALLGFLATPKDIPLELFAQLSGQEGYLGVVDLIGRRDGPESEPPEVHPVDRARQATVEVGASGVDSAWRFPLDDPGLMLTARQIVAGWDDANDGQGARRLEEYMVRQIRLWRPEVIVTQGAGAGGDDQASQLTGQAVLAAVDRAADPTSYAEQVTVAGLGPWQVKRVFGTTASGTHADTTITTWQLAPRLGKALADVTFGPRGLVERDFRPVPPAVGFRLLRENLPRRAGRLDFFSGIVLEPGGGARRTLLEPAAEGLDGLRRIAQKQRNTRAIIEQMAKDGQTAVKLAGQVGDLTRGLDPDSSAQTLYHLAHHYFHMGNWTQAAEMFDLLRTRHPQHPLARSALTWLVQYYASTEAAWRIEGPQRVTVQQTSVPVRGLATLDERLERAADLGKHLAATDPSLSAEPAIGFPLATVSRRRGFPGDAERLLMLRARSPVQNAWWACARTEQWLTEPEGVPPKPIVHCTLAESKPLLDARLDDPVWQRAAPAKAESAGPGDVHLPTEVMLAYDSEFLYLAIRAQQVPGVDYPKSDQPRPNDADLSGRDRVDVLIDLDRDFATYYRLTIDHRGWTGEACWCDSTWNPTWFVAASTDGDAWIAEAAIGLDQLTGHYPTQGSAWAVGIQRIIPGAGLQSWNTPAAVSVVPEGFGYLVFD